MSFRGMTKGSDPFSNKTSRNERFAQMSQQEMLIEQKKREIEAKIAQKQKETETVESKSSLAPASTTTLQQESPKQDALARGSIRRPQWRGGFDPNKWKKNTNPKPAVSTTTPNPSKSNCFVNDGSFLDQFKKAAEGRGKITSVSFKDDKERHYGIGSRNYNNRDSDRSNRADSEHISQNATRDNMAKSSLGKRAASPYSPTRASPDASPQSGPQAPPQYAPGIPPPGLVHIGPPPNMSQPPPMPLMSTNMSIPPGMPPNLLLTTNIPPPVTTTNNRPSLQTMVNLPPPGVLVTQPPPLMQVPTMSIPPPNLSNPPPSIPNPNLGNQPLSLQNQMPQLSNPPPVLTNPPLSIPNQMSSLTNPIQSLPNQLAMNNTIQSMANSLPIMSNPPPMTNLPPNLINSQPNMNPQHAMNPPPNINPPHTMNPQHAMNPPPNMNPMNPPPNLNPQPNMNPQHAMNPPPNLNPQPNMNPQHAMNPPPNLNPQPNMNPQHAMNPPPNINPQHNMNSQHNINPQPNMSSLPPSLNNPPPTMANPPPQLVIQQQYAYNLSNVPPPLVTSAPPQVLTSTTLQVTLPPPALASFAAMAPVTMTEVSPAATASPALTAAMAQLARMVAEGGNDIEEMARERNRDDPTMWFLYQTDSSDYKQYRDLVDRIKAAKAVDNKLESGSSALGSIGFGAESSRPRKKRSRWGDKNDNDNISAVAPGVNLPVQTKGTPRNIPAAPTPMLSKVTRTDPNLLAYAMKSFGSTNLSDEDWKKCEDHYKVHLLYHDMLRKREQLAKLERAGKHKYEYDSDEETDGGTWEHKLRSQEMEATERWADELTRQAEGKHHIGDFLPPHELEKFMEKYSAKKEGREPDLSDYKEYKLREDNIGFKMLQKLGWTEGQGLGSEGQGITTPVNKAPVRAESHGLGLERPEEVDRNDDEYEAYRKRMMLAYRFRPNPLNNPRRSYY